MPLVQMTLLAPTIIVILQMVFAFITPTMKNATMPSLARRNLSLHSLF
jgi:hypothetical protein